MSSQTATVTYTVTNLGSTALSVGGRFFQPFESHTLPYVSGALLAAASAGLVRVTPSDADTLTLQASQSLVVDGSGGVATPGNIPAIAASYTQANVAAAVATLAAAINQLTAQVNNLNAAIVNTEYLP